MCLVVKQIDFVLISIIAICHVRLTQGLFLAGCSMTPKYNLLDHHEYLITRSVQQIQIKAKISIPIARVMQP
ncbi:hypothetical protein CFP56_035753 [Quercus suber]|uniref:Secreted protein n=1 Tax=Quercus suber TaxID=58331 RepID=A0AAW0J8J5_QUESU